MHPLPYKTLREHFQIIFVSTLREGEEIWTATGDLVEAKYQPMHKSSGKAYSQFIFK